MIPLTGCGTIPYSTAKGYTQLCQSFIGQDIENLIDLWGHPQRTLKTADGNKVYVYREIIDEYGIDITYYSALVDYPPFIRRPVINGDVIGGFYVGENCVTWIETNKQDKIVKVIWKGECRAPERLSYEKEG